MMHYKDESGCRSQNGTGAGTGTNGLIRHCGKTRYSHIICRVQKTKLNEKAALPPLSILYTFLQKVPHLILIVYFFTNAASFPNEKFMNFLLMFQQNIKEIYFYIWTTPITPISTKIKA